MSNGKLAVWFLSSELAHESPGGIGRYLDSFARLLGASGHDVTIVARSRSDGEQKLAPNVRVIGFEPRYKHLSEKVEGPPDRHPSYPYNVIGYSQALSFEMAQRVLELLRDRPHPDIIESQEFSALPYYLLQRKLTEPTPLERIPILVHLHGPLFELGAVNQDPHYRFPEYWTGQMEKFCIRAADAVLTPSRFLAQRVAGQLGISEPPLIPYPMTAEPALAPHPGTPGELLYVGRIQWLKGVLPLVEACSKLWAAGRDFRLTLVGADTVFKPRECSMQDYIRRRFARPVEAGRLTLTGVLSREELRQRMQTAWALVIPSLWENFPLVCIEAMSAGQLVVVSRTGGHAEMVEPDGENGFIFDWEGPASLESRLQQVLDLDASRRAAIVERSRQRVEALCDPQTVLARRVAHYRQVIDQQRPKAYFPAAPAQRPDASGQPAPPELRRRPEETAGLLSVVVPYYNMGPYLRDNIESVRRSSYRPVEIVVVNDGSTDPESLALLAALEQEGGEPAMRVVHTQNQGLASARNNGADAARGEFVCFLDADDCVEPEYFERCIHVLKRFPNVGFVYPWVRYFGESSQIWPTWNAEFPYALGHNMAAAFAVQRRSAFLRFGRNKPVMAYALEDFEMWISLLENGVAGVSLPALLARYRVRKDSMLQTSNESQMLFLCEAASRLHPASFAEWAVELFNLQQANGPSWRWVHPATRSIQSGDTLEALRRQYLDLLEETQRIGKAWEDQNRYIGQMQEGHHRYIAELEAARDKLWSELEELARHHEEQRQYTARIERERGELDAALGAVRSQLAGIERERGELEAALGAVRSQRLFRLLARTKVLRDQETKDPNGS